eukprot:3190836-Prymnesium_polylepis.1
MSPLARYHTGARRPRPPPSLTLVQHDGPAGRAGAGLVHDLCVSLCVGPRSRRSRISHACHVRMPRPRTVGPLTHMMCLYSTARGPAVSVARPRRVP